MVAQHGVGKTYQCKKCGYKWMNGSCTHCGLSIIRSPNTCDIRTRTCKICGGTGPNHTQLCGHIRSYRTA